jgi:uncharacterized protein YbbC (DUF1343 family)
MPERVRSGLENLIAHGHPWTRGTRLGLLCNPASVGPDFHHARHLLARRFPGALVRLFSPQHGFFAEKQDNMVESDHLRDPDTGLPVFSLYGATRMPTDAMLDGVDVLLVDLLDVGTRVYTFATTLAYCMQAARRRGTRILVLDRPNPVGGLVVEGNLLDPRWSSFVGPYPIPMRHGLTMGELARLFNAHFGIGCRLEVVPMGGWQRGMHYRDTGLPWVLPSPNLPTPEAAAVYPGQVLWEGTNASEGRGTALPFELCGAPDWNPTGLLEALGGPSLPGAVLRPCVFEPTSGKNAGRSCRGFQLHVTRPREFRPFGTSLRLLQAVIRCHGDAFAWKAPPYEYELDKAPIDLIIGDGELRRRLESLEPLEDLERSWEDPLRRFDDLRRRFFLYPP